MMSILGKFTGRYDKSRELFCVSVAASSPPNTNRIFEFFFFCLLDWHCQDDYPQPKIQAQKLAASDEGRRSRGHS